MKQRGEGGGNVLGAVHGIGGRIDVDTFQRFGVENLGTCDQHLQRLSVEVCAATSGSNRGEFGTGSGQTRRIVGTKTGLLLFFFVRREPIQYGCPLSPRKVTARRCCCQCFVVRKSLQGIVAIYGICELFRTVDGSGTAEAIYSPVPYADVCAEKHARTFNCCAKRRIARKIATHKSNKSSNF